jgi:hypothetical protein
VATVTSVTAAPGSSDSALATAALIGLSVVNEAPTTGRAACEVELQVGDHLAFASVSTGRVGPQAAWHGTVTVHFGPSSLAGSAVVAGCGPG